jgi:short-subunit dehydrogenase
VALDLRDRVIIVTGASSGIGAAPAGAGAEAGMDVVLAARRADRLDAVAERVRATGRAAEPVVVDVAERGASERLLDAATARFGRFDAVFSNAGYGVELDVLELSDDDLRRLFEVNFFASIDLCRAAARRWIEASRPGHLLLCSSCLAKFSLPEYGPYAAAKASQALVARAMREELASFDIEVASVHPITTTTEFFEVATREAGRGEATDDVPDHVPGFMVQRPEVVARAIVRCLRRPRSEVWTSTITRLYAGWATAFPGFHDFVLRRMRGHDARRTERATGG